jgi:hypothetical protein
MERKSRDGKSQRREEKKKEDQKRESQKQDGPGARKMRKGRKVAKHCVFAMMCGSGGAKSTRPNPAGAEPFGQMRHEKNCTPLWREANVEVNSVKN